MRESWSRHWRRREASAESQPKIRDGGSLWVTRWHHYKKPLTRPGALGVGYKPMSGICSRPSSAIRAWQSLTVHHIPAPCPGASVPVELWFRCSATAMPPSLGQKTQFSAATCLSSNRPGMPWPWIWCDASSQICEPIAQEWISRWPPGVRVQPMRGVYGELWFLITWIWRPVFPLTCMMLGRIFHFPYL